MAHFCKACGYIDQKNMYLLLHEQIKKQLKELTKLYKKILKRKKILESEAYFVENDLANHEQPYYYIEGYGTVSISEYQTIEKYLYRMMQVVEVYISNMSNLQLTLMNVNNFSLSDVTEDFAIISFFCMQIQKKYKMYLDDPSLFQYEEILQMESEEEMKNDLQDFMSQKILLIKEQLIIKKGK